MSPAVVPHMDQKISMPNYQKMKTMVKISIYQKLRSRNFDARHGRIETGAVIKNRKGMSGVEGGKGICYQWKEKGQCSKGDQCSFWHESNDRAPKPEHTAATFWAINGTRSKCVEEKKYPEAIVTLVSFFDNRVDIISKVLARDRLVSVGILSNVNSLKLNRDAKPGMSVCSRITRLMKNQIKSPKRPPSQKERESDDKKAVAIVKTVPHLGCVSQDSESFDSQRGSPGETRRKKSWDQVEEYDSPNLCYVKQVSGKTKDHRLEKYKSNFLISEVPTLLNIEDRSQEEAARQQRCAQSKAWNLAKKHFTSSKSRSNLHSTRPQKKWVLPVTSIKEPEEREFVVDSWASMHIVRKKDVNSAELKTMRMSESYDGDDGQRRDANQRRSDRKCQTIGLIRQSYASWRNSRSSVSREALRGSWVFLPLDQRSKTTSHQKGEENWLQYIELCTICGSWFISEFFLNYTFTYYSMIFITGFRIWCQQIHWKSSIRKEQRYEWGATGRPAAWNHRNRKQK